MTFQTRYDTIAHVCERGRRMNSILRKPEIQRIIYTVLDHNWNTDYAIRYVTVEISKLVQRDLSFFQLRDEEKLQVVPTLQYETTYPYVMCKSLHLLIKDVLDYIGIDSKLVQATNSNVPLYALVVDGEHGRYFIDALNDLAKVQYRIQPVTYGNYIVSKHSLLDPSKLMTLSHNTIREMDLDLGVIENEYFSDSIERMKSKYIDRNQAMRYFEAEDSLDLVQKKISQLSDQFLNCYPVKGPLERVALHVYFRNQLFNKSERERYRVHLGETENQVILLIDFGGYTMMYEEVKEKKKNSLIQKIMKKQ